MNAWIFDVDGVLSNLQTREVSQPSLLSSLAHIIQKGDLLAFNTGRDPKWITDHIIIYLKKLIPYSTLLQHTFLSCEKGGVWQEADQEPSINQHFVLPTPFVEKVRKLIKEEFHDACFFDSAKRTMISLEMRKDVSVDYFATRQQQLHKILTVYLQTAGLTNSYTMQEDRIATDIIYNNAGKDAGMEHILTWTQSSGYHISHYYCFGDNPSDLHMGELLQEHDLPFTFVYTGTKSLTTLSFAPMITEEKFDKGTAQALTKLLA